MALITFIEHDGSRHEVTAEEGRSLMEGAVQYGIEGIIAECGGACACATCHCYIAEEWTAKTGGADDMEAAMLDAVLDPKPTSRLSCQLTVTSELDGLVVHLPESQI